jgi:aspartyl-tRNA(Asn)/glutamyl-tRNA(Gln) amidotransferase subunit A
MYLNDVYTVNCNLAGNVGISLQGGTTTVDGKELPIGIQLLGPAFDESRLLKIARVFEAATDHHTRRPKL